VQNGIAFAIVLTLTSFVCKLASAAVLASYEVSNRCHFEATKWSDLPIAHAQFMCMQFAFSAWDGGIQSAYFNLLCSGLPPLRGISADLDLSWLCWHGGVAFFSWHAEWLSTVTGLDLWTGLVDWTSGLKFKVGRKCYIMSDIKLNQR